METITCDNCKKEFKIYNCYAKELRKGNLFKYERIYKKNKYRNTITYYKNIRFSSKKEKSRYIELKQLEKAGIINELELQPKFLLLDTIHYKGKTYPKTYYKADFKYFDNEKVKYIVEDVKSPITAKDKAYRLKIKMLLTKYPDIEFVEVI